MTSDDQLLLDKARHKDRAALDTLIGSYANFVYGSALRQTRDAHLAQDITQAVFLVFIRRIDSIRVARALPGFFAQTTRYCVLHANRLARRRAHHEKQASRPEPVMPDPKIEISDDLATLDAALGRLRAKDRDLLLMRFFQQRSVETIAADLGIAQAATHKRLARAIDRLRAMMTTDTAVATVDSTTSVLTAAAAMHIPLGALDHLNLSASSPGATLARHVTQSAARHKLVVLATAAVLTIVVGIAAWLATRSSNSTYAATPSAAKQPESPPVTADDAAIAAADAALAPERGVALDPNLPWRGTDWGDATELAWTQPQGPTRRFGVSDPQKRKVWFTLLNQPIDVNRFPLLTVTYRASNTQVLAKGKQSGGYLLYFDDGTGTYNAGLQPFYLNDVIGDGATHQLKFDLRVLKPTGKVRSIALAVFSGKITPTTFDLISLRFEAPASDSPLQSPANDQPISVVVTSAKDGSPIAGADVVVDPERRNYARRALTDASGKATVIPVSDSSGNAPALRVSKEGMAPDTIRPGDSVVPVRLTPTTTYSGRVLDQSGQTVEGAVVRLWSEMQMNERGYPSPELAITDSDGHWQAAVPETVRKLTLTALAFRHGPALLEVDRTDNPKPLEIHLPKPQTFRIKVVDADGKPVYGALVSCTRWRGLPILNWSATTDRQGRVTWTYGPNDPIIFYVLAPGPVREYQTTRPLSPSDQEQVVTVQTRRQN